ncbi:hypothetical protein B0H13DRAFT_2337709 [Mycena leptocephala]|nr:hypothetical protein B0H13DRAFT_2337709 [Mycena leptocephala]
MTPPPSSFNITDSTLRGRAICERLLRHRNQNRHRQGLDAFDVEYIELTSPVASEQSRVDCEAICKLGLQAKILTHIRCNMDVRASRLKQHGKDMAYITKAAIEVIQFVKSRNIEIRFSSEESFRSDLVDLLSIYQTVDKIGVHRVGIADTVGCANPRQVYDLIRTLRGVVGCVEVHLHNDTAMAIANAYTALEAGATHIDTSVLGVGERNDITPLGGLIACLYRTQRSSRIQHLVALAVEVKIPFMNPITGDKAFAHKDGVYDKFQGIVSDPSAQVLKLADFGLGRAREIAV